MFFYLHVIVSKYLSNTLPILSSLTEVLGLDVIIYNVDFHFMDHSEYDDTIIMLMKYIYEKGMAGKEDKCPKTIAIYFAFKD